MVKPVLSAVHKICPVGDPSLPEHGGKEVRLLLPALHQRCSQGFLLLLLCLKTFSAKNHPPRPEPDSLNVIVILMGCQGDVTYHQLTRGFFVCNGMYYVIIPLDYLLRYPLTSHQRSGMLRLHPINIPLKNIPLRQWDVFLMGCFILASKNRALLFLSGSG